jgi:cytochrome P450
MGVHTQGSSFVGRTAANPARRPGLEWLASANRDEDVFDNPDAFEITRNPKPHLAFGYGQHFCLGANLARVEMRTTLEELIPYLHQIELADEPQRTGNSSIQGYWRMPIRFRNVKRSIHL